MKTLLNLYIFISFFSSLLCQMRERYYFDRLSHITSRGVIVVGMNVGYHPFQFRNEKEEICGFDVDIAKKLAEALNVELEIKDYPWTDLIPALKNLGEIDIIISGMTRTLERAKEVNFTDPYFVTGQVVVLSEKNNHISNYQELDKEEKKIAVVKGTTGEEIARKKIPKAKFVLFDSETEVEKPLLANEIDAFVFDKPYVEFLINKHPQLKMLPKQLSYEFYSFAVNKGELDFLLWLNYFIAELKLTGEYDAIYNKWFKKKESP